MENVINLNNKELLRLKREISAEIDYRKRKIAKDYVIKNTSIIETKDFRNTENNECILKGIDALKQEHEVTVYISLGRNKCAIVKHTIGITIPSECTYISVFSNDD